MCEAMPSRHKAPLCGDYDLYLLGEDTHYRSYEKIGFHIAVWAPRHGCQPSSSITMEKDLGAGTALQARQTIRFNTDKSGERVTLE
jgi:hypothetical protein